MPPRERAGVLVVRDCRLAVIQREVGARRYWVIPGGGIEPGESVDAAARREAVEELGVPVTLGQIVVRIHHREADGTFQVQSYFAATVASDELHFRGPERLASDGGAYAAQWIAVSALDPDRVLPSAVTRLVVDCGGRWPERLVEIDER